MNKWFIVTLIGVLGSAVSSQAQKSWTLQECIEYGLNNSLSIRQAQLAEDNAIISLQTARHSRFPSLSASSSLTYSVGRSIDPTTNDFISESFVSNGVSLGSGVTLFNGLRIHNSIRKSGLDKKAAEEDTRQWKRDIAMNIATGYMTVLFATENLENARTQVNGTRDQLDKMVKLVDAGARPESDRYDMEAQMAMDEQNLVRLENDLKKAYLDLENMIRYDGDGPLRVSVPDIEGIMLSDPNAWNLEELYVAALSHQPSIAAGEWRLQSARIDKKIAESAFYPSLGIGGSISTNYSDKAFELINPIPTINYQTVYIENTQVNVGFPSVDGDLAIVPYGRQLKDNFGFGAGLQLSIPIYSNNQNRANIARAKLSIKSTEIANEQEKQQLKSSLQVALSNARAAKKQLEASRKSFEAMELAFTNATRRFELGQIGSYEFLDFKTRMDSARTSLLIARYDYIFSQKVIDFYIGLPLTF